MPKFTVSGVGVCESFVFRFGIMAILLFFATALCGPPSCARTQVFLGYSAEFGGTASVPHSQASRVAGDPQGNAYVTGTASLPLASSVSGFDVEALTIKYDPQGRPLWKAWLKSPANNASGVDIGVDGNGNTYVLFSFYSQVVGGRIEGQEYAVAKYNAQGTRQWINYTTSPGGNAEPGQVQVTRAGNVYVSGSLGPTGFTDGPRNVQLTKYDTAGKQAWTRQVNHVANNVVSRPKGLELDAQENVFIAMTDDISSGAFRTLFCEYSATNSPLRCFGSGEFSEIAGFHVDEKGSSYISGGAFSLLTNGHNNTLAKHNPDGSLAWKQDLGPVQPVLGGPIFGVGPLTTDSSGNVLVLERRSDSAGNEFVSLRKLNPSGTLQWEVQHPNDPVGTAISLGQDLRVNAFGETYIFAVGAPNGSSLQERQIMVLKYGADGKLIWETSDTNDRHSNIGFPAAMALAEGNLLVAGFTQDNGLWVVDAFVQDAATLAPTSLQFGSVPESTQSSARVVTLTNASAQSLPITSITTTGDFHQTNNCPATLVAGESCTISVVFTPTELGTRTGTLIVRDPFLGNQEKPATVQLSGTGVN